MEGATTRAAQRVNPLGTRRDPTHTKTECESNAHGKNQPHNLGLHRLSNPQWSTHEHACDAICITHWRNETHNTDWNRVEELRKSTLFSTRPPEQNMSSILRTQRTQNKQRSNGPLTQHPAPRVGSSIPQSEATGKSHQTLGIMGGPSRDTATARAAAQDRREPQRRRHACSTRFLIRNLSERALPWASRLKNDNVSVDHWPQASTPSTTSLARPPLAVSSCKGAPSAGELLPEPLRLCVPCFAVLARWRGGH